MRLSHLAFGFAMCAGMTLASQRASAQSWGCMRLPSTNAQFLGYGYGAGHHAPLVRTPGQRPDYIPRRTVHPAAYGPLWPAEYQSIRCHGECDACGVAPSQAMPAMHPPVLAAPMSPAPMYAPAPQPHPQLAPPMAQQMGPSPWR